MLKIKNVDMENSIGQMVDHIRGNGIMVRCMVEEFLGIKMEMKQKENGMEEY